MIRKLTVLLSAVALAAGLVAARAQPAWHPPTEPSPFMPDGARCIGSRGAKLTHFRGVWEVAGPVRRAVLMTAPMMTARVYLNGRLVLEAHDSHQALPEWADVTDRLQPGPVFLAARVHSDWRPLLYCQMRVEYEDGRHEDLVTGPAFEWCDEPGEGWQGEPRAAGDWQPVEDVAGYHQHGWQRRFALMPRDMLREHFAGHNARLREAWEHDRRGPVLELTEAPDRPEWAAQFDDFCTVDETTGQLVDGAGRVRHLFFTIYNQHGTLALAAMDLEQLERDLELMAQADVHIYMRFLGWATLLDENGEWAPLERQPPGAGDLHFDRAVDLLDHLVRRARAWGRYIIFQGDFFWSAHDIVPPPYRSRYHLYPEILDAQALATRKIMHRYSGCTNVLGMMIGEEDIVLHHDLDNPHQHALFTDFLRRKYGTVEEFRRQTPWAYDYSDRSAYVRCGWRAERWPGRPEVDALVPGFTPRTGVFDAVREFDDIPLPLWPRHRCPEEPEVTLGSCTSHNQFTPEDPLWIDFYQMREDELLFGMLERWVEIVREAMPRQLLFYSNAQDFTSSWHFLHLYRRADLPFDVIGVGCHDDDRNLADIPAWATVRKAIKNISSYRPYVRSPGSPARGIASGEGCGGDPEDAQGVLDYYRATLFDEIGGGAAWTQTYTWDHISGRKGDTPSHLSPLLEWMGEFMPAVQGVTFPLHRPVEALMVRVTNLAHSNMSGLDYGNALTVGEALAQLNVEFDIVMDRDLVYEARGEAARFKVDLAPYRLVILPTVAIDLPEAAWEALDAWLSDPAHAGERVLALGRIGKRGPRLQPTGAFHPMLRRWLGCADYASEAALQGPQTVELIGDAGPGASLQVNFGRIPPTGVLDVGAPVLRDDEGRALAVRVPYAGNEVYACGFFMGFAHEPLWGMAAAQAPRDALAPFYEHLAQAAALDRPVLAPPNLRVYVAEGARMLLVRERAGVGGEVEVALRAPAEIRYEGLDLGPADEAGYRRFRAHLEPWESRWWKASATAAALP